MVKKKVRSLVFKGIGEKGSRRFYGKGRSWKVKRQDCGSSYRFQGFMAPKDIYDPRISLYRFDSWLYLVLYWSGVSVSGALLVMGEQRGVC